MTYGARLGGASSAGPRTSESRGLRLVVSRIPEGERFVVALAAGEDRLERRSQVQVLIRLSELCVRWNLLSATSNEVAIIPLRVTSVASTSSSSL